MSGEQNRSPLMTTEEVAQHTTISVSSLTKWRLADRGPPFVKLGSRVMYRREDVDRWVAGSVTGWMQTHEVPDPNPDYGVALSGEIGVSIHAWGVTQEQAEHCVEEMLHCVAYLGEWPSGAPILATIERVEIYPTHVNGKPVEKERGTTGGRAINLLADLCHYPIGTAKWVEAMQKANDLVSCTEED